MLVTQNDKSFYKKKSTINLNGHLIDLSSPSTMGIVNITPDSFYDGGIYSSDLQILNRASQILEQGGKFIDIGAMSTRPGAKEISLEEELARLMPVVKIVKGRFPDVLISVDTYRSQVVQQVFDHIGDFLVNDISGGTFDDQLYEKIAALNLPILIMHTKGRSEIMQQNPVYTDVVKEVILFLSAQVQKLKLLGVCDILIDPGFGFGKTSAHNFELLNRLDSFRMFELPVLVGLSRKAMIWKELDITPAESLNGTTALHSIALLGGCDILRVHDVKEAMQTIRLLDKIKNSAKC